MRDTASTPFEARSREGKTLYGALDLPVGEDRLPVILITHGFKGFMEWGFFPYLAELLASRGFAVVRWNTSGSGMKPGDELVTDEEAFATATFSRDVDEILDMIEHIPQLVGERTGEKYGLFGHSRGGGATVVAAADVVAKSNFVAGAPVLSSLATWAAIATFDRLSDDENAFWVANGSVPVVNARTGQEIQVRVEVLEDLRANADRLDIARRAAEIDIPWLVVHGEEDATVDRGDARRLTQACPAAELVAVPESGHTFEARHPFQGPTPGLIQALNATQSWFLNHLR